MAIKIYTTSFPGIGSIASQEISDLFGLAKFNRFHSKHYDINIFDFDQNILELKKIRTVEDAFLFIDQIPLTGTRKDLKEIKNRIIDFNYTQSLHLHRNFNQKNIKKTTWRVIAQSANPLWQKYRRLDLQNAVEIGIKQKFPRWKLVEDNSQLEFWLQLINHSALIGLRLTDKFTRHRHYKNTNIPGSLRPTIAASLVYLSQPDRNDIVFDPFCGAGTILIERALAGPHRLLIGSDIAENALTATRKNFGKQHQPWELYHWDSTHTDLPANSIEKIITNPPWDIKIKAQPDLIPNFLKEADRIIKPAGLIIFITNQPNSIINNLHKFTLKKEYKNIQVLGQNASILVLKKS